MTQYQLENIEVPQLNNLTVDDIKTPQFIGRVEELAEDSQFESEPISAREFYEAIDELLVKFGGQINGTEIYKRLFLVKTKMFWYGLPSMEKKLKVLALSENFLYSLKNEIDVASYISAYLDIFEYGVGPDNEERQMFLLALTRNDEPLGTQPIKLKTGETVRNTVMNWIKDYLGYAGPSSLSGESYEMTQYMYTSPNVKSLNANDKQLLSKVIITFNYLKNPKYLPVIEPEEQEIPKSNPIPAPVFKAPAAPAPISTPQPKVVATPVAPPHEMSAFEKKLAQISAQHEEHGEALAELKKKLQDTAGGGQTSKVIHEVKQEIKTASLSPVQEIKREVETPELPAHVELELQAPKPVQKPAPPKPVIPPAVRPAPPVPVIVSKPAPPKPAVKFSPTPSTSLDYFTTLEDLKKIEPGHLRQGEIGKQAELIRSLIITISNKNKTWPYYAVRNFEQSPLFQAYLMHGNARFTGNDSTNGLTQEEFEAVADLKKKIEQL